MTSDAVLVISSQVPVGTSRTLVNLLKKKGIENPSVIYFPENLRLGDAFLSFLQPDRIILGSDNDKVLKQFEKDFSFGCPVITMGLESAEMVKHALNSYLAMCISFSSELSDIGEKVGADMLDVVKALKSDKRVSVNAPLFPGLGFSGGTLGRDVQSLRKTAKELGLESKLMDAVYDVNKNRLSKLIQKIRAYYPSFQGKTIGILGLTYKPRTNTLRRSMSLELATLLKTQGAHIKAFDPAIKENISSIPFVKVSVNLKDFFKDLDVVVLMTDWAEFKEINPQTVAPLMTRAIIVDTKNFLDSSLYRKNGFTYVGIGTR
jgi:UDPglucose 6-dehydrogenase